MRSRAGRARDFAARHVFHPLQGMALGEWAALLRRHRFAVDAANAPRAALQAAIAAANSAGARLEEARFGHRIDAAEVREPLFLLGHYRGGTTHLHNLLALDPRRAAPTLFQVLNPHTFLGNERAGAPVAGLLIARHRYQDRMAQGVHAPAEDELALAALTGMSPYLGACFPAEGDRYDRYLTFRDASGPERARWGAALDRFLRKLTVRHGRPLVLKSPPHTARVAMLLGLFPDARFVHIRRDPYAVFASTRHTLRATQPLFQLGAGPTRDADGRILAVYTEMYDAYFAERPLIPEGRLCEVGFEDLERDGVGVVGSIYDGLGLAGFDDLRPRLEAYLGSLAGYRKNRLDDLPDLLRRRIADAWGRSFDAWGYDR